jgi:hypothetical protein
VTSNKASQVSEGKHLSLTTAIVRCPKDNEHVEWLGVSSGCREERGNGSKHQMGLQKVIWYGLQIMKLYREDPVGCRSNHWSFQMTITFAIVTKATCHLSC